MNNKFESDWDLLKAMVTANNSGDQEAVSSLIIANDFTNSLQAQCAAISAFELTRDNISKHKEAANKLSGWDVSENWPITTQYRHAVLQELIADLLM